MTISLCMLVKNIIDRLHLIDSMIEKDIFDEIIIVDNGSTDGTVEQLLARGCIVIIERQKELDECRNLYLSKVTSDWILVLDSDEIVFSEQILNFKNSNRIDFDVVKLKRYDYYGKGMWSESYLYRLFRNRLNIRYNNTKIHATISTSVQGLKKGEADIQIHHYDAFLNNTSTKNQRYNELIDEKIEFVLDPREKAYLHTYKAIECYSGNRDVAEKNLKMGIELFPNLLFAKFLLAKIYLDIGDTGKVIEIADGLINQKDAIYTNRGMYLMSGIAIKKRKINCAREILKRSVERQFSACMYINLLACEEKKITFNQKQVLYLSNVNIKNKYKYIYQNVGHECKYIFSSIFLPHSVEYISRNFGE